MGEFAQITATKDERAFAEVYNLVSSLCMCVCVCVCVCVCKSDSKEREHESSSDKLSNELIMLIILTAEC